MKNFDMAGKRVLITGASQGIGAAAALAFAQAGAKVAIFARNAEKLKALASQIGVDVLVINGDVANFEHVNAAVVQVVAAWGGLDVFIGNAGTIGPMMPLAETDPSDWETAIDVNTKGVAWGMRAALPVMLAQGGGTIITVSSGAAHAPVQGWSAYCTSKAGALMLTRMADLENRDRGIRVLGLSPGTVATQMQRTIKESGVSPVSQLDWSVHIPPEWPAQALLWMCTPAADSQLGMDVSLREDAIRRAVGLI